MELKELGCDMDKVHLALRVAPNGGPYQHDNRNGLDGPVLIRYVSIRSVRTDSWSQQAANG